MHLKKAYNSVSWDFLHYIMRSVGFDERWRSWGQACILAKSLLVSVNGFHTHEIYIRIGLKKGDLLASFLFLLVVEGLSASIRSTEVLNLFSGFKIGNSGLVVSHL